MVATLISIVGMFMIIKIEEGSEGGSLSQVLVYLLSIGDQLQWSFRQVINVDTFMQSAERC